MKTPILNDVGYIYVGGYGTNIINAQPVIDAIEYDPSGSLNGYVVCVAWDESDALKCRGVYLDKYDPSEWSISYQQVVQDCGISLTGGLSCQFQPTISRKRDVYSDFMVGYTFINRIYSVQVNADVSSQGQVSVTVNTPQQVSSMNENAVYAASITRNADDYVIAYEVNNLDWLGYNRYFVVKSYSSPNWNTTATMIPIVTNYQDPINPSLGYHETQVPGAEGLRVVFHRNWGGGFRVAEIETGYTEYVRSTNGSESFASIVPYAPEGELLDIHSVVRPDFPSCITWGSRIIY